MKLPKITKKQQEILILLYRYRFLNRIQIQSFMGHADKRRIGAWLKDLREKHYIEWLYDPNNFAEKTKPAIYFIGINGVRWLKQQTITEDSEVYVRFPLEEVRKRYRESTRSRSYIDRCLLLADCCLSMNATSAASSKLDYTHVPETDFHDPDSDYAFLSESEYVHPHLYYRKTLTADDGTTIVLHNLFTIFDSSLPRQVMRRGVRNYVAFVDNGEWEEETGNDEPPIILFACQTISDLIYVKRRIRYELYNLYDDDIPDEFEFLVTTVEKIKEHGFISRTWEVV